MNAHREMQIASDERTARELTAPSSVPASDSRVRSQASNFAWRQLSLDKGPVAPLAEKPKAPFADSDRKRAITVARYYAECQLNGVDPFYADSAAEEAQKKYDDWWVRASAKQNQERALKRQKVLQNDSSPTELTSGKLQGGRLVIDWPVSTKPLICMQERVQQAKQDLVEILKSTGGDTSSTACHAAIDILKSEYDARGCDARWSAGDSECILDGTWFTLSKPTFSGCMGKKRENEYLYRLGRLSFDMFRPTPLLCSIQGCFNYIGKMESTGLKDKPLPLRLFALRHKSSSVRRYDISESLTIEAEQTREGTPADPSNPDANYVVPRPIKGVMINEGFAVPDPNVKNRISCWFIAGKLQVEDVENDLEEWKRVFDQSMAPRRETKELARILAARVLLGAEVPDKLGPNGCMAYRLNRPIGGHGSVYVDVLYCDESLRILRGHQGSIYVSIRSL